jgi:hypothetical protein
MLLHIEALFHIQRIVEKGVQVFLTVLTRQHTTSSLNIARLFREIFETLPQ